MGKSNTKIIDVAIIRIIKYEIPVKTDRQKLFTINQIKTSNIGQIIQITILGGPETKGAADLKIRYRIVKASLIWL